MCEMSLSSSSSLSFLVKLEQLDLGSNVLEVLVRNSQFLVIFTAVLRSIQLFQLLNTCMPCFQVYLEHVIFVCPSGSLIIISFTELTPEHLLRKIQFNIINFFFIMCCFSYNSSFFSSLICFLFIFLPFSLTHLGHCPIFVSYGWTETSSPHYLL